MKKLFIIGNGFDKQHDIHYKEPLNGKITTSLKDFSEILKRKDKEVYKDINNLLNEEGLCWEDLEKVKFMSKLDKDDKRNKFYKYFKEWIRNLNENIEKETFLNSENKPRIDEYKRLKNDFFDNETYFLNLNYTTTLEDIYNINQDKILYLHLVESLIIAYNESPPLRNVFGFNCTPNFEKPVNGLKFRLNDWINDNSICEGLESIYIYGVNFNGTDKEYLETILQQCPNIENIKISDYQAERLCESKNTLYDNIKQIRNKYDLAILDMEGNSII